MWLSKNHNLKVVLKPAKGMESDLTTEAVADNSGAIENIFDKEKVQAEIDLQVKVTQ